MKNQALIIGAGIGGLTTALLLNEVGIAVEVFEAAQSLRALGVGINLQPHAVKIFAQLGLVEKLSSLAVITSFLDYRSENGALIIREKRGLEAGYHYPQLSIHRGELHMCLLETFKERIGIDKLHLGHRFKMATSKNQQVTAHFEYIDQSYTGDCLIGADGIHSAVRQQLHPANNDFQFEGIQMWRGTTRHDVYGNGSTIIVAGNPAVQLITYPISPADEQNKALINWVVEIKDPHANILSEDLWNKGGKKADFQHYFDDWQFDDYDIQSLFNHADCILEYPMVDRDPLTHWGNDRMTLLGDAAHPMYPRGGNGATQAIIDAAHLSQQLSLHGDDIPTALKAYEQERRPATARIVQSNRSENQTAIFDLIAAHCDGHCKNRHHCVEQNQIEHLINTYKNQAGFNEAKKA